MRQADPFGERLGFLRFFAMVYLKYRSSRPFSALP